MEFCFRRNVELDATCVSMALFFFLYILRPHSLDSKVLGLVCLRHVQEARSGRTLDASFRTLTAYSSLMFATVKAFVG